MPEKCDPEGRWHVYDVLPNGKELMSVAIYQITAPYFTAGLVVCDGKVKDAAPIIRYMIGWTKEKMAGYAQRHFWKVVEVKAQ